MNLVLVTGATGFIGRHLLPALMDAGHRVRAVYHTREPQTRDSGVEWIKIDSMGAATDWTSALVGVTHIMHLAGLAHQLPGQAVKSKTDYREVNVLGTQTLAKAAGNANVRRMIFVSSLGAVTSKPLGRITLDSPCIPETPYGKSKLEGERALKEALNETQTDWCVIRPPLVYGPGNPGNMERLVKLVQKGTMIPLGTIRNARSFVYVGNLVDALLRCMDHPAASRKIFFISDGTTVSTPELIRQCAKAIGKPANLWRVPFPFLWWGAKGCDVLGWIARRSVGLDSYALERLTGSLSVDDSTFRAALEWEPPYTLEQGLAATFVNTSKAEASS